MGEIEEQAEKPEPINEEELKQPEEESKSKEPEPEPEPEPKHEDLKPDTQQIEFDYKVPEEYKDLPIDEKIKVLGEYSDQLKAFKASSCSGKSKDKLKFTNEEREEINNVIIKNNEIIDLIIQ